MGLVDAIADVAGVREDALRLLLSVLASYGFSLIHRLYFYNKPKQTKYFYFIAIGIGLYLFNYGIAILHSALAIVLAYLITNFLAGTTESVIAAHVVFLGHLLVGYWYAESDQYDITWTTPFCIMCLRFIGLVMDVYDGVHFDTLKADQKLTAIRDKPDLIEIAAFGWFFTGTLVGPQFTLSRFRQFVDGHALDENGQPKQSALMPSLGRFLAGCTYMVLHQWGAVWITSEWLNSDDFDSRPFFARWTWVTIWFRLTMYRYCAMWLISEGSAILNGIAYNGKDEKGEDKWDGTRDLHIWLWEYAHDFTSCVLSFNVGTNTFAKNHIFRRLRWLNSKLGAHLVTLTYLAVWHGYHLGYFLLFFFEFGCVVAEQQLYGLINRTPGWAEFIALPAVRPFVWLFGKLLINYSMASTFLCMGLIKTKYWIRPAKSLYFCGFILYFVIWPITYQVLLRVLPRKPKVKKEDDATKAKTVPPTETKKEL